jgi:hypothetical protein
MDAIAEKDLHAIIIRASGSLQFWASGSPSSLIGRLAAWKRARKDVRWK